MKVSLITVVFNCADYISCCMESVRRQDYTDIEYIVIDGGSTDGTMEIISKYNEAIAYCICEKDNGFYDALNKGIVIATGELIGILNADDQLAGNDVISMIVTCFKQTGSDAVYGNLNFISRNNADKITRKWRSQPFKSTAFKYGWMPAHPTLYLRKELYEIYGNYLLVLGSCADYELMLRLFYKNGVKAVFIDKLVVIMRDGGMSNGSVKKICQSFIDDYRALVCAQVANPLLVLFFKKIRKLNQFFH